MPNHEIGRELSLVGGFVLSIIGSVMLFIGSTVLFALLYSIGVIVSLVGTGFLVGVSSAAPNRPGRLIVRPLTNSLNRY